MTIKVRKYKFAHEQNLLGTVVVSVYKVIFASVYPVVVVSINPVVVLLSPPPGLVVSIAVRDQLLQISEKNHNTHMAQLYSECTATWQLNCI